MPTLQFYFPMEMLLILDRCAGYFMYIYMTKTQQDSLAFVIRIRYSTFNYHKNSYLSTILECILQAKVRNPWHKNFCLRASTKWVWEGQIPFKTSKLLINWKIM